MNVSVPNFTSNPNLNQRIVTALLGAATLLLLVIYGKWVGVFFLTAVLSLAMTYEYSNIVFSLPDAVEKRYAMLSCAWFVLMADLLARQSEYEMAIFIFLAYFVYFLWGARQRTDDELGAHFKELCFSFFGLIYLTFIPLYLPRIHETPNGVHWTLLFFLMVWAGDTGAYFAGMKYGKTKLYVRISPKKTREGALGGLGSSLLVALLYKFIFFRELSFFGALLTPLAVGVAAQAGDLCESFLKRAFDRKDSGSILPGHGGVLDRFDAIVFSLPVMYACTRAFG